MAVLIARSRGFAARFTANLPAAHEPWIERSLRVPAPTIEIYSSIDCPDAYLAIFRLRQVWPEYANRLQIRWRALALEYVNRRGIDKPLLDVEVALLSKAHPDLPIRAWARPEWQWPTTLWPAFEALACAQAQSHAAAFAMSWALRRAFFAESRDPSLRHEVLAIAREVASETDLDPDRFIDDWDGGRYKATVIAESRRGWDELKLPGSPTFILPNGEVIGNPAGNDLDYDEERQSARSFQPFTGDPLAVFRDLLDRSVG